MDFDELMLCDAVRRGVQAAGFSKATPVQEQVLPKALEGNDLLVFAETGTGKTAAYGLPILERLSRVLGMATPAVGEAPHGGKPPESPADPRGTSESPAPADSDSTAPPGEASVSPAAPAVPFEDPMPRRPPPVLHALILGPTRESVTRAEGALRTLGQFFPARIRAIFGGVPAAPQREALRRGLHVIAATPGRLAEILRQEPLAMDQIEVLVLDELDHMVQMNLMGDVLSIVERIPAQRQTFVFAGKRTADLDAVAARFLRDPQLVEIQSTAPAISDVRQVLYPVDSLQKSDLMLELLRTFKPPKAVIFFRTRRNVDRLQPLVEQLGRRVAVLHADRTPAQRQVAIEAFTSNEAEILLATEMAVRSLEVEGITHLINFDLPQFPDDYLNRISRCSTLGPIQEVLTLVCLEDRDALRRLEKHLAKPIERVKLPGFDYSDRGRRNVDRILAPMGETRQGRRPLPPSEKPEKPLAATEAKAIGRSVSAAAASPGDRTAPSASVALSASGPGVEQRLSGAGARTAPNFHSSERLSGRLTRPTEASSSATEAVATPAPAAATALPESAASKSAMRSRPTLGDEVRHPRVPPPRAEPPRTPPPPAPPAPARPPTPLPVSAAPALAPSEPQGAETPSPAKSYPSASFTSSRKEDPPPRSRSPYRHGRKPVQPEWVEEVLEPETLANGEEPEDEDDAAEIEPTPSAPDSRGAAPAARSERGAHPGRTTDRRPARRIRSWDLHRGGLLDPPPLLSTPYDTFLAEERQARKRDSQIQSEEERLMDFPSETIPEELLETEGAGILPIDWDHPVSRHGRVGHLIVAWKKRLATLQALGGTPTPPGAPAPTVAPRIPAAVVAAQSHRVPSGRPVVPTSSQAGLAPPALPAWPMAADSATSAATAPGAWWTPSMPPAVEAATAPAPASAKAPAPAREQSQRHGRGRGKSESRGQAAPTTEQSQRRGRGHGRHFRKESERPPAVAIVPPKTSIPSAAPTPQPPPAPPSMLPSAMPPPANAPATAPRPKTPSRPASRAKTAPAAPQSTRGRATAATETASRTGRKAAEKPAPATPKEPETKPEKPTRRSPRKSGDSLSPARPRTSAAAPVAAEKKKPGRKPAAPKTKAPEKAAEGPGTPTGKKKPGRKPIPKESASSKKTVSAQKNAAPGAPEKAKKR
jgi:ATP-dependent RNA helicase RhlE